MTEYRQLQVSITAIRYCSSYCLGYCSAIHTISTEMEGLPGVIVTEYRQVSIAVISLKYRGECQTVGGVTGGDD